MAWVRLDDQFAFHAKVLALPDDAFRLHVCALCWCNGALTDGRIPTGVARRLPCGTTRAIKVLVAARIWKAASDGYVIHDYLEYQRSAAEVVAIKAERAAAGARGGTAKASKRASKPLANGLATATENGGENPSKRSSKPVANDLPQYPVPSTQAEDLRSVSDLRTQKTATFTKAGDEFGAALERLRAIARQQES